MANRYYIKIKEEAPYTHYFVYKQKKYPIIYDLFKMSSQYFLENSLEFEKESIIQLIDPIEKPDIEFSEETIQNFIKYVHRKSIPISNENVVQLNFLANKYKIFSLISDTKEYISIHQDDLSIEILLVHQHDPSFEASTYEDILSEKLMKYIKDERLLKLEVPILYRILSKYEPKTVNKKIIDFLFKCLDKKKNEASVLFGIFDFGKFRSKTIDLLMRNYSKTFDFHFINSSFLKTFYDQQNEIYQREVENKNFQENMMKKIEQMNEYFSQKFDEQRIKNEELESHILMQNKIIEEQSIRNEELVNQIKDQEQKIHKLIGIGSMYFDEEIYQRIKEI